MIKLVLTDVDGTLVPDGGHQVSPRYFEVIRQLAEKGILFGVASGRQVASIWRMFAPVKDQMITIANNGAYAVYRGEELFRRPMDKEISEALIRDTRKLPGCMSLYDTGTMAYFETGGEELYQLFIDEFKFNCTLVDDLTALEEPCLKFTVYRESRVEEVTGKEFSPKWKQYLEVACGGGKYIDIEMKGVTKGAALVSVQEMLGITPEETVVVGDNLNDLEMLDRARYSFAIGNARKEVRQVCTYVTDDLQHDGVLRLLEYLLEHGEDEELFEQFRIINKT